MTAFPAVLLICPEGHQEATVGDDQARYGVNAVCSRCGGELTVSRRITVVPGRRHSEMGCHQ